MATCEGLGSALVRVTTSQPGVNPAPQFRHHQNMSETLDTVYLNGNFLPIAQAKISPLDRGFLFGDAAYEVIPVFSGKPLLVDAHLKRLARSLGELRILNPNSETQWKTVITELIERNGAGDLALYIQVSRGADNGRNHVFPDNVESTVFSMVTKLAGNDLASGITAITLPDNRWGR